MIEQARRHQFAAILAAAICIAAPSPAVAQQSYTTARAQIDLFEDPDVEVVDSLVVKSMTEPSFAEVGTAPGIFAKARAGFGDNGAYAVAVDQSANLGAYAESIWADSFNISGGTGTGVLDIRVVVRGTLDGAGRPGGPGSNSSYQLYMSKAPISCDFDDLSCSGTLLIPLTEPISGERLFTVQVPFTYGEMFYIASYLSAEVLGNGFSDFYNSAHFGATAPGNAAIVGGTGFNYRLASAVPEPSTAGLLLAGIAVLGCAATRTRARPSPADMAQ